MKKRTYNGQANSSPLYELTSHRVRSNWSIMTQKELSKHNDAEAWLLIHDNYLYEDWEVA